MARNRSRNEESVSEDSATETTEIVRRTPSIEQLKAIQNFDDVKRLAAELNNDIVSSTELGDGFALLDTKDKDRLIGLPIMVIGWNFSMGDMGEFVTARVLAQEANGTFSKYIINDGSTGIYDQLKRISQLNPNAGIVTAIRGLRKSEYFVPVEVTDEQTGETSTVQKKSTTYYIDTSAVRK